MRKSLRLNILVTVFSMMVGVSIAVTLLVGYYHNIETSKKTESLIREQISLIVKKLDLYRVLDQVSHITRTVYNLNDVVEVYVVDRDCEILRQQPVNAKMNWNCPELDSSDDYIIYDNTNIFSDSGGTPRYIVAKIRRDPVMFYDVLFLKLLFGIFVLVFAALIMLIFCLNRFILKPIERISSRIIDPQNKLENFDQNESAVPVEFLLILDSVEDRDRKIDAANKALVSAEKAKVVSEVAEQVAHDIRSPLGSIGIALENLKEKPEQGTKLLNGAYNRIREILKDLETAKIDPHMESKAVKVGNLLAEVLAIVEEKRVEYPECNISTETSPEPVRVFKAKFNASDLKRIFSNLINNSIEAGADRIQIKLSKHEAFFHIEVSDNGSGIPNSIRQNLFKRGVTAGKKNGKGLGLYFALTSIESWGGIMELLDLEKGTLFRIQLPQDI